MAFKVFGDKVVFRDIKEESSDRTAGGIYIPEQVRQQQQQQKRTSWGEVVYAGDKCERVKVGDKIMYDMYSAGTIEYNGENLSVAREGDLVGKDE